jgi:tetratricopeptide (TPR) repeat protein
VINRIVRPRSAARGRGRVPAAILLAALTLTGPGLFGDTTAPPRPETAPSATPSSGSPAPDPAALVERGNAARQRGRIDEAIALYREAARLDPRRYEVRILIADTLRRSGRVGEAGKEYDEAVRLAPGRPEGYAGQALVRRAVFDYEGAAAILTEAGARIPAAKRPDLVLTLAETRRRQGRIEEAERLFRGVLATRPEAAPADAGLAQTAEARGDLDRALAAWDRYLKVRPEDGAAAARRQELLELRAALAAVRDEGARSPRADLFAEEGRLRLVAGDAGGAAAAYRNALEREPGSIEARRGLALALRDAGDRGGAAAAFRSLLQARPGDAVALYNLVGLERASGEPGGEEKAWRALLETRPGDLAAARAFIARALDRGGGLLERALSWGPVVGAQPRRALLLAAAGRGEEATAALAEALERDPTDPYAEDAANEILQADPTLLGALARRVSAGSPPGDPATRAVLLARLEWWGGKGGDALIHLRQTAAAAPRSALARSALAEAYGTIARAPGMALQELRRAVALEPSRAAAHVDLAIALLRAGRAPEAGAEANAVLALDAESAPGLAILGAVRAERGDLEGAAAAYERALLSDPADALGLAGMQYPVVLAGLGRQAEARRALRGLVPPLPEVLYEEAWAFARDTCRDRHYNGQNWTVWRDRFHGHLATVEDAYRAIASMLDSLGDPYTRLRDGEETAAVFLARRGDRLATDPLGRTRPESPTVVTEERPGGLGYIRVGNFSDPRVVAELRKALEAMRRKEGIILDLRGNPGGFARAAEEAADLLAGPGKEAGTDVGPGGAETRVTAGDGAITESPLTVLVDGQTASAAERLARDLVATGRGTLVGDTTHGKGRAQRSRVLPGGATVLVSAAEILDPEGRPVEGRGLRPRIDTREPAP